MRVPVMARMPGVFPAHMSSVLNHGAGPKSGAEDSRGQEIKEELCWMREKGWRIWSRRYGRS